MIYILSTNNHKQYTLSLAHNFSATSKNVSLVTMHVMYGKCNLKSNQCFLSSRMLVSRQDGKEHRGHGYVMKLTP